MYLCVCVCARTRSTRACVYVLVRVCVNACLRVCICERYQKTDPGITCWFVARGGEGGRGREVPDDVRSLHVPAAFVLFHLFNSSDVNM